MSCAFSVVNTLFLKKAGYLVILNRILSSSSNRSANLSICLDRKQLFCFSICPISWHFFPHVDNHVFQRFFLHVDNWFCSHMTFNTKKMLMENLQSWKNLLSSIQQKHAFFLCNYTNFLLQNKCCLVWNSIWTEIQPAQLSSKAIFKQTKYDMLCLTVSTLKCPKWTFVAKIAPQKKNRCTTACHWGFKGTPLYPFTAKGIHNGTIRVHITILRY